MTNPPLTPEEKKYVRDVSLQAIMEKIDQLQDTINLFQEGIKRDQAIMEQTQMELNALTLAASMLGWKQTDNTIPTTTEERPKEPGFFRKKHKREVGGTYRVKSEILNVLNTEHHIILKDAEVRFIATGGTCWRAAKWIIEEEPDKYEWYKDLARPYHPKGIRKKSIDERLKEA